MRPSRDCFANALSVISIHAPVKGATLSDNFKRPTDGNFNPRTREGCDDMKESSLKWAWANFNPRTREGCDGKTMSCAPFRPISIHAPVKGATFRCRSCNPSNCYFNPRTREGCDFVHDDADARFFFEHFNPRTREGCDDGHRDCHGY